MKKILFIVFCLASSITLLGQTHIWIQTNGDSDWFNAANWSTGTVPNSSSIVEIPDGLEVTISGNAASANAITLLGSAILTVNNNLIVTGSIETSFPSQIFFNNGVIEASLIENFGTIRTETAELKDFKNTTINNHNMFKIVSSNILRLYGDVVINNMENATIEITANGGFIEQDNASAFLNNFGLVTKFNTNGGFGSFYMIIDMVNNGILEIEEDNQYLFLSNKASLTNTSTGILRGAGIFDITSPFINEGTVAPGGDEIGTLTFVNTFNLNGGVLEIDINTKEDHDIINVVGSPILEGDIIIKSHNVEVTFGDTYSIDVLISNFEITSCDFPAQIEYATFDGDETRIFYFNVACGNNTVSLNFIDFLILDTPNFKAEEFNFNLQSNPITTEAVFVIEASSITEDAIIKIYDLTGKKIATSTNITETTTLNLERFANGIYLAKFESNGRSKTIKILVQH